MKLVVVLVLLPLIVALNVTIPIYFPLPAPLRFLALRTSSLLEKDLKDNETKLKIIVPSCAEDIPDDGYWIKLGYAEVPSYYVDPFGRSITIFQTDSLIAHNTMPEFIKNILVDEVFHLNSSTGAMAMNKDRQMSVTWIILMDAGYWDVEFVSELMAPVLESLSRVVQLDIKFEVRYTADATEDLGEDPTTYVDWSHGQITQLIVLTREIYYPDELMLPRLGSTLVYTLEEPLGDQDMIQILEKVTGQLFRVLGSPMAGPQSVHYKLDRMVIDQVRQNYNRLDSLEDKRTIEQLVNDYKLDKALQVSWSILTSSSWTSWIYPRCRSNLGSAQTSSSTTQQPFGNENLAQQLQ